MNAGPAGYSARVLELFRGMPGLEHVGAGPGQVVKGEAMALERGAWVCLEARVHDGRIVDCVFRAWGCPHLLAAASWICVQTRGLGVEEAAAITARRLSDELTAPAEKMGRLLVAEDALRQLLAGARALQSGPQWQSR